MADKTNPMQETKVITGKVRFSYLHVFRPNSVGDSEDAKYSVSLIIPKSDTQTIKRIKAAIKAAAEQGKNSKFNGKVPANLKHPLRDGDEDRPDDEAYADAYFINASSATKPGVVDKNLNPIIEEEELYSGCYGRASINFYTFNSNGNRGIAAGLNNLQKLTDGDPLGGRQSAEADFSGLDDDFEDDDDADIEF